jgi:UDP-N-acetyl-2-amino-2-deoxyglucuronate dehydrogenase
MAKYQVAVLGCGSIFSRHLAALKANSEHYDFIAYYDPSQTAITKYSAELDSQHLYSCEDEAYSDFATNCIILLTPSHLHYAQAKKAMLNHKSVILEKPATFSVEQLLELETLAAKQNVEIFCVLQVRLNHSIGLLERVIQQGLLGEIRSSSLVQRWQRPLDYFTGWRGTYAECGGVLFEFGIHYLDIMQYLLGMPKVTAAKFFKTKFKDSEVDDSAYALLDFGSFGGTLEVTLAAEPSNIEVSLIIMGSNGYIKLGGKSLDQVTAVHFLDESSKEHYNQICNEVLGYTIDNQVAIGACPHHPELYKQIISNPAKFRLQSTYNVIKLVTEINELGTN